MREGGAASMCTGNQHGMTGGLVCPVCSLRICWSAGLNVLSRSGFKQISNGICAHHRLGLCAEVKIFSCLFFLLPLQILKHNSVMPLLLHAACLPCCFCASPPVCLFSGNVQLRGDKLVWCRTCCDERAEDIWLRAAAFQLKARILSVVWLHKSQLNKTYRCRTTCLSGIRDNDDE